MPGADSDLVDGKLVHAGRTKQGLALGVKQLKNRHRTENSDIVITMFRCSDLDHFSFHTFSLYARHSLMYTRYRASRSS